MSSHGVRCLGTAMPDREACRGRDSNGCPFGAIRQVNRTNKRSGTTYYKRLCFQCNAGKRPASRSPSPQRRPPVHRAQNCFGDDASAVSHRQVGRGRAPEGTSWTGSQHEFDNPTSADATASPRSETAAAANTTVVRRGSKRLAVFGWLSCIRDTTLLVNGKCISDQYHEDECPGCCQCSRLVCELCRDSQDNEWYVHWTKAKNRNSK